MVVDHRAYGVFLEVKRQVKIQLSLGIKRMVIIRGVLQFISRGPAWLKTMLGFSRMKPLSIYSTLAGDYSLQ